QGRWIALGLQALEFIELARAYGRIVDPEHVDRRIVSRRILVDPDDGLQAGINASLGLRGRLLNAQLGNTGFDRLGHAAKSFDLFDMGPGLVSKLVCQPLNVI